MKTIIEYFKTKINKIEKLLDQSKIFFTIIDNRILIYITEVSLFFYGVFTGYIGLILFVIIEDHIKTKHEYFNWKQKNKKLLNENIKRIK